MLKVNVCRDKTTLRGRGRIITIGSFYTKVKSIDEPVNNGAIIGFNKLSLGLPANCIYPYNKQKKIIGLLGLKLFFNIIKNVFQNYINKDLCDF